MDSVHGEVEKAQAVAANLQNAFEQEAVRLWEIEEHKLHQVAGLEQTLQEYTGRCCALCYNSAPLRVEGWLGIARDPSDRLEPKMPRMQRFNRAGQRPWAEWGVGDWMG